MTMRDLAGGKFRDDHVFRPRIADRLMNEPRVTNLFCESQVTDFRAVE